MFTCAVSRDVHLEIVENCSEKEFLNAFRRFVAQRSLPSMIISDNATTFEAANRTLKSLFNDEGVKKYFDLHEFEWKFIVKRAPWTGGFYERLIGITKLALKKVLGNSLISLNDLRTLIVEIEGYFNDRSITYVSGDLNEFEPLTPSHLIFGYRLGKFPDVTIVQELNDPTFNDRKYFEKNSINFSTKLNSLWSRWQGKYLVALREAVLKRRIVLKRKFQLTK